MPAISPAQVERFHRTDFREEVLEIINSELLAEPGTTVTILETELAAAVDSSGSISWKDVSPEEMDSILCLYRAVGWRVIYSLGAKDDAVGGRWLFNAHRL